MKPGEIVTWLKSTDRYAKVTSVRLNQDDARCIALTASSKRFASVEAIVTNFADVFVIEALDAKRSIVGALKIGAAPDVQRTPDAIETSEPQSPAGLMAAYARHIAAAYRDGGNAVRDATRDASQELTALVRSVIDRLNALEEARTREMNARARALEQLQPQGDDGDGMPSLKDLLMMRFMGIDPAAVAAAQAAAAAKTNGAPPNGAPKS